MDIYTKLALSIFTLANSLHVLKIVTHHLSQVFTSHVQATGIEWGLFCWYRLETTTARTGGLAL